MLQQMKSGFKTTINRNKYKSIVLIQAQNQYLDHKIEFLSFQGTNSMFYCSKVMLSEQDT